MIDQKFIRPAQIASTSNAARALGVTVAVSPEENGVHALRLRMTARAIAANSGKKGAIVITLDADGIHVASDGLSPDEVREALCTAIHASFPFNEGP